MNGANYRLGLATNNVINFQHIDNGIYIDHITGSGSSLEFANSNSLRTFQTGDVFRILRKGNKVSYLKNDSVLRTVTVNPSLALKIKACLYFTNSNTPLVNSSFWQSDGIVRTYYSIASGNWTTPSVWSISDNGPPSTVYPDDIDKVVIKGHEVTINSNVNSAGVTITATNDNTRLKVDGNMGVLSVKGNIVMKRENNANADDVLLVQNNGRLEVK